MEESTLHIIIAALLLLFPIACLVSCVVAAAFEIQDEEEQRMVSRLKLPVSIVGNAVSYLIVFAFLFPYQNPVSVIVRLTALRCSYQDFIRLAMTSLICLACAVLIPAVLLFIVQGTLDFSAMNKKGISTIMLVLSVSIVPIIAACAVGGAGADDISIIEVCRKTVSEKQAILSQELEEDKGSYVILHNNGFLDYEADSLYLSSDEDHLQNYLVKRVKIEKGGDLRINMNGKDGISLKRAGGSVVYLSSWDEKLLDSVQIPGLEEEEAYRKTGDKWEVVLLVEPEEEPVTVGTPVFSADSGFYDSEFDLTITSEEGTRIYYTLDGSNPTAKSDQYTGPIHVYNKSGEPNRFRSIKEVTPHYLEKPEKILGELVDKAFVVRAVSVDSDGNLSEIATHTYLIDLEKYKQSRVISLVSDPDNLFGETGIYVNGPLYDEWYRKAFEKWDGKGAIDISQAPVRNYQQRGIQSEREANLEIVGNDGIETNQRVGIRIQGASARSFVQKRFSINARKEYGNGQIENAPIGGADIDKMVLREGEANALSHMILKGRDVAVLDSVPVSVFLNGEFWGQTFLFEKYDERYFREKYNILKDNACFLRIGYSDTLGVEERIEYDSLQESIRQIVSESDEKIKYEKLNQLCDMQSYVDYLCANFYLANCDFSEHKNLLLWRSYFQQDDKDADGRWRWGMYDMDLLQWSGANSEGVEKEWMLNPFTMTAFGCPIEEQMMFKGVKDCSEFRQQFAITIMDMANTNFSVDNVKRIEEYVPEFSVPEFFLYRMRYAVKYVAEEFSLSPVPEPVTLTSNRSGAPITLNTITPELENGTWSGQYFTDYPVTVTANEDGFSHWEVTINGKTKTLQDKTIEVPVEKGGVQIYAVYQ